MIQDLDSREDFEKAVGLLQRSPLVYVANDTDQRTSRGSPGLLGRGQLPC
jgi:hypothetical protein